MIALAISTVPALPISTVPASPRRPRNPLALGRPIWEPRLALESVTELAFRPRCYVAADCDRT